MFWLDEADSFVSDLAFHHFRPVHHMSSYLVLIFRSGRVRNLRSFTVADTSMDKVALALEHLEDLRPPCVNFTVLF